jgi:flagellar basal-body rod modification protein FlgD
MTTALAAVSNGTSAPAAVQTNITGDFNTFLKMLTTQLQHQDPTNAMDPTELTNQLVSFSQVEQQISMNSNLQALISLQQTQALTTGAELVGRTVSISGNTLPLQDGRARLQLPAGAAVAAQVQVADRNGAILRSETVRLGSTPTAWSWNGRSDGGARMPDGAYTYSVTGLAPGDATTAMTASALGTATGVQRQGNGLNLMFGSAGVPMDRVVSVE